MARWDKFLNEASRGYGLGFQRYQQYDDARDKRLNRQAGEEIAGALEGYDKDVAPAAVPTALPTGATEQTVAPSAVEIAAGAPQGQASAAPRQNPFGTLVPPRGQDALTAPRQVKATDWDTVRRKYGEIMTRQGDYEGLAGLDEKIRGMQQSRMLGHLKEAMQTLGKDPKAAAQALYQANQYLPDGVGRAFFVQDGKLHGYDYDENTGKFIAGRPVDEADLAKYTEYMADPVAFQKGVEASLLAKAEREWEQKTEERRVAVLEGDLVYKNGKLALDKQKHADGGEQRAADLTGTNMDNLLKANELLGLDDPTMGTGWKKYSDRESWINSVSDSLGEFYQADKPASELEQFVLSSIPMSNMQSLASVMAAQLDQVEAGTTGRDAIAKDALVVGELMAFNKEGKLENATLDELIDAAQLSGTVATTGVGDDGMLELIVNGRPYVIPANEAPQLVRLARAQAERGDAPAKAPPAPPKALPDWNERTAGQKTGSIIRGAATGTGRAIADTAATVTAPARAALTGLADFGGDIVEGVQGHR